MKEATRKQLVLQETDRLRHRLTVDYENVEPTLALVDKSISVALAVNEIRSYTAPVADLLIHRRWIALPKLIWRSVIGSFR